MTDGLGCRAVLADTEIREAIDRGRLVVTDFDPEMIRPASLRLRLGSSAFVLTCDGPVDAADETTYPRLVRRPLQSGRLPIHPGEVVLVPTLERLTMPDTLVGLVDSISDVARLGLTVVLSHQVSPGFGAPGGAVLTLEIVSHLSERVYLWPGDPLCKLMLLRCGPVERGYSSLPFAHSADTDATPSYLARARDHRGR